MIDVVMPKMGESITEGTILEWKKKVGDSIKRDEPLLEISTDKVDSEIPSPASGTIIEITAKVNETVLVGSIIAQIGEIGEKPTPKQDAMLDTEGENSKSTKGKSEDAKYCQDTDMVAREENTPSALETSNFSASIQSSKRFYSPLVKSIAKKEGIAAEELDSLIGSGQNGRVNKQDILMYLKNRTVPSSKHQSDVPTTISMLDRVEPMSRMRKKIADHMVQSVHTSPHVYTTVEADVTTLVHICSEHKDNFKNISGVSLTYTPMIIDACVRTIRNFPLMNTSLEGDNIVHHKNINMGVAVALPDDNLIVPVIHASEEKNFLGLARSTSDLATRARENKLNPDEIFGSTFTVTNPGIFGGLFGMGIINQPNVGILAVGTFQKRPVVKETQYGDTIVVRHMVYLTLSYDHRIIDGAYGTRFMARLVEHLENYNSQKLES